MGRLTGYIYRSIIFVVATATISNAACLTNEDLAGGIVYEITAPKGTLFNVLVDVGERFVVSTRYSSLRLEEEKLIVKSYLGLFTEASWLEKKP